MWKIQEEEIKTGIIKYKITKDEKVLNYSDWMESLKNSTDFIEFFIAVLKASTYDAFFWEVKPVNKNKLDENFEFVLVESKHLPGIKANDSSFKQYFKNGKAVISFPNLGGDAQLVVPNQIGESLAYAHLARFVRQAPLPQVIEFWKKVGAEYEKAIGESMTWLSTAGLGVYWLHVRIDSRPKYYRYEKYRYSL